jgi:hypothetical protein
MPYLYCYVLHGISLEMFLILWKDEDVGDFPPPLVVLKLESN